MKTEINRDIDPLNLKKQRDLRKMLEKQVQPALNTNIAHHWEFVELSVITEH